MDEDKLKNGITQACPLPAYGQIEQEIEENIEEDDESARRRN